MSPLDVALPPPWEAVARIDLRATSSRVPEYIWTLVRGEGGVDPGGECYWCAGPLSEPGHEECEHASLVCIHFGITSMALLARLRGEARRAGVLA